MEASWKLPEENESYLMRSWGTYTGISRYQEDIAKIWISKRHKNCVLSLKRHIRVSRWTGMFTQKELISEGNLRCIFFLHIKRVYFCSHSWRSDSNFWINVKGEKQMDGICCRLPSKREILKVFKQIQKKSYAWWQWRTWITYIFWKIIEEKYVIKNLWRSTFSLEDERSYWINSWFNSDMQRRAA